MYRNKSVEQSRIIEVETLEDIVHQCLANKFAAIGNSVPIAVFLQCTHLAIIKHNAYPMISALFCCSLDH